MPKIQWNTFITNNKSSYCFSSAVSSALPQGYRFDKNNKKLLTPYGLFQEWLKSSIQGDWASIKVKGSFFVRVVDKKDAQLLINTFGASKNTRKTPACSSARQLHYKDSSYRKLASSFGYVFK